MSFNCSIEHNIFIVGDFNIPEYSEGLRNSRSSGRVLALKSLLDTLNLQQYNLVGNSNNRTLDLVMCGRLCNVVRSLDRLVAEDPQHPPLSVSFDMSMPTNVKRILAKDYANEFNFRKANFPLLYSSLQERDWSFLNCIDNIDLACRKFYDSMNEIFQRSVPKTKRNATKNYPPWFHSALIKKYKT